MILKQSLPEMHKAIRQLTIFYIAVQISELIDNQDNNNLIPKQDAVQFFQVLIEQGRSEIWITAHLRDGWP